MRKRGLIALSLTVVGIGGWLILRQPAERPVADTAMPPHTAPEARIRTLCATCHHFPEPAILPKPRWPAVIDRMYGLMGQADNLSERSEVKAWFVRMAPEHLPAPRIEEEGAPSKIRFNARALGTKSSTHGISQVTFLRGPSGRPDILYADVRSGEIGVWHGAAPPAQVLARVKAPARVEPVDLDQDGRGDYIVADLGLFMPTNYRVGRVVWLRYRPQTDSYEPRVLGEGLGRVADVRAADMDGDGDSDLVVAVFGWTEGGELLYMENQTQARELSFSGTPLDSRSGATRLQIADVNADGRPDIVALMSQAHEQVIAWVNQGNGSFTSSTLHETGHPDFGYSGMRVADMDADGDMDVLVTNGDAGDVEIVKPQHSVHLLENEGRFPFTPHRLATLPGAYDVAAGDLDGDGDQDVAAVAWLPVGNAGAQRHDTPYPDLYNARESRNLSTIVWLEQRSRLQFAYHTIEKIHGDHVTLDIGDYDGDGDLDLVTGNLSMDGIWRPEGLPPRPGAMTVWENGSVAATGPR